MLILAGILDKQGCLSWNVALHVNLANHPLPHEEEIKLCQLHSHATSMVLGHGKTEETCQMMWISTE